MDLPIPEEDLVPGTLCSLFIPIAFETSRWTPINRSKTSADPNEAQQHASTNTQFWSVCTCVKLSAEELVGFSTDFS